MEALSRTDVLSSQFTDRIERFVDDFYQLNPGTLPNLEEILDSVG
jgi:hypothetical protein